MRRMRANMRRAVGGRAAPRGASIDYDGVHPQVLAPAGTGVDPANPVTDRIRGRFDDLIAKLIGPAVIKVVHLPGLTEDDGWHFTDVPTRAFENPYLGNDDRLATSSV